MQDGKFRAARGHQPVNEAIDALALRPHREDLADNFRKLNQIIEAGRSRRPVAIGAIGQFCDPVQNADRQRFMTLGTDSVTLASLRWLEPDPALTVPVQVILAFFGIELDRARQPVSGAQRRGHREVVHVGRESGRFPAQHRR